MPFDYFNDIPNIIYEGPDAKTPFAYRYYNPERIILGKTMEEHLRFAVCYWHSFCWDGFDIFGAGTLDHPWFSMSDPQAIAESKMDAAFAFFSKLGLPYFCFHDVDIMAPAETPVEYVNNFRSIQNKLGQKMEETSRKLLWGTANLFSHPRYAAGGATNPNADVTAFAALQVRECLEATNRLGGQGYVLWGGREGYDCLLNTDLRQEREQYGRFLSMVVEHKHKIGFEGGIWIEPKPCEPTKHQYDFDVCTVYGFLKQFGLEKEVGVNVEANHATLAGHSFEHEIEMAFALDIFGSIDMNRGDPQNGWDTDQFPNDIRELTLAIYAIVKNGGFKNGGLNFDAKVRRQSNSPEDLFHGHIGAVDLIARALLNAEAMIENDQLGSFKSERYSSWKTGIGSDMLSGKASLSDAADHAFSTNANPAPRSGRQEMLENAVSAECMASRK